MRHSPEALLAFAEAAALGSFSAAARKLGKRQSTISEAIGNLEIDLGLTLFDRGTRQPTLTEAGRAMLAQVRRVLEAGEQMDRQAAQPGRRPGGTADAGSLRHLPVRPLRTDAGRAGGALSQSRASNA